MRKDKKPGRLFVIDGNDGSGKHTQAEMLRTALLALGRKVLLVSFPRYGETFFGRLLRRALDGQLGNFAKTDPHLASIVYAADRWSSGPLIRRAVARGEIVICDRYASANQIHQGGKIEDEAKREDFLAWLYQLEYGEFGIPKPSVSIYLDVPPQVSLTLMKDRRRDSVESDESYLENSHASAQWLMRREPTRWIHIHCTDEYADMRGREPIHREIMEHLERRKLI